MSKINTSMDWELAARIFSGEASKAERNNFKEWLKHEENLAEWNDICKNMSEVEFALLSQKIDVEQAWYNVKQKTKLPDNRSIRIWRTGIVAAAASVIIAVIMFLNPSDKTTAPANFALSQTSDSIQQVGLDDGSRIDLNRNSSIQYPSLFAKDKRYVTLSGEAFFDIAADRNRPFIINTQQIKISVVGTAFNVKALPNASLNEVCVREGKVLVSSLLHPHNSVELAAGDKAIFNMADNSLTKMKLTNNNYIAWKTREITFKNEKLIDAITLIEEVYNVSVIVPEKFEMGNKKITATFDKYTIDHIMRVFGGIYGDDFEYRHN
ncbi:FecR family protein [Saccharicrinis carchari]|nr:FecR family protein [Saccharicrinis carchari]